MGKEKSSKKVQQKPLHVQLTENILPNRKARTKYAIRNQEKEKDDEFVDSKLSQKILKIAKEQQEELEKEQEQRQEEDKTIEKQNHVNRLFSSFADDDSEDDYSEEEKDDDDDIDNNIVELKIDENDQEIFDKFISKTSKESKTLSDIIMEKIESQQNSKKQMSLDKESSLSSSTVNPKIVEVYSKVGTLLSGYKSGKIPKAFKIIPSLPDWEDILYLTKPENWTPHATLQATRIFASNLNDKQSQRFFDIVLLDKVRDDIKENKKLNPHLYMALKKALYKPAAFFKGILFPLCESGTCTLKEAAIVGSVISKVSIPMLHSSAALLRLAEMDYSGPSSLFIRILLDKKYALPYKVVDALVFHFIRFKNDERKMPVLWHQSFLVFAQRYKQDLTPEQKEALFDVLKSKLHEQITPEIRREIANSVARDEIIQDVKMEIV